jgi:hypothetical protein
VTPDEKVMVAFGGFCLFGGLADLPIWMGVVALVVALSAAWHMRGSW